MSFERRTDMKLLAATVMSQVIPFDLKGLEC